ncbi:M1 family metallopeptidase [Streptomyces sulfonofaciens]|nr:M1 family metallopeptidase [Streptomyces sulfonofaciens]
MHRTPRRRRSLPVLAAAATVAAALTGPPARATAPVAPAAPAAPSPGAPGLGDPLLPLDGNGGYTVRHYTLDFDWQAPRTPFAATATIRATATQALSRFDLDFAGNVLRSVTVDGRAATFRRDGDELVITPAAALADGRTFTVQAAYTADPTQVRHRDDAISDYGWIPTPDGTVLYPQPNGAKMVFPADDHPSLRAPFTFRVTTPPGLEAVANGRLADRTTAAGGRVRWTYESGQPVTPQYVQLAIGQFTFVDRTGPHGLPIRDAVPDALAAPTERYLKLTPDHVAWLEQRLGPYPFDRYGVLVGDTDLGVALETQGLALIPRADLLGTRVNAEANMVHELTHQWLGVSVALKSWSDLWLSEGHARYYERLHSEAHGGDSLATAMRQAYRRHDQWRHDAGAPAEPTEPDLFRKMRYDGSALVLYALREKVGDTAFERIERAWSTRCRGRAAGTQDFVDLVSQVSGQDLSEFLHPWLHGPTTPPMPGHPDWVVDPVAE